MDHARLGLKHHPFRSTPDTDAYFAATPHEQALAGLRRAWGSRDALALVDGESGTGKTLVALKFLDALDADVPRLWIPAPRSDRPTDLFQAVLFDLGVNHREQSEQELRLAVTDHLLTNLAKGHPTVLVIDEAQHLEREILEELRLLGNLETRAAKALFVVLLALPALRKRLQRVEFAAIAQRMTVRCKLDPLGVDESVLYLRHHVRVAGGKPDKVFTDEATQMLAEACKGRPRILNQAASLALHLADGDGEPAVDVEVVMEAAAQLGLAVEDTAPAVLPHPGKRSAPAPEPRKARAPKRRSA